MTARVRRHVINVPVTTRLDGSLLNIPVIEVEGDAGGPTLTVISGLHGSEWLSVEMIRRVVGHQDLDQLRGRIRCVPVANPPALEQETRMTPDRSDEPDLNRVWPGGSTWLAEQIAGALTKDVLTGSDVLVDFHTGPWGATLVANGYARDLPDPDVTRRSVSLAVAFGHPIVRGLNVMGGFPGPRSLEGYASGVLGIPSIAPNLGGLGFGVDCEDAWIEAGSRGVLNVARYLGMLPGEPQLAERYFHFSSRGHRVVPSKGGLIEPRFGPDALERPVAKGTVLGSVISPYTFEPLEELVAPVDGILFGAARSYMARPGDWAYFVAGTADADSRWVDATGTVDEIAERLVPDMRTTTAG